MPSATESISKQRRWQRLPLAFPVMVRGTDAQGRPFVEFGSALNISAGGALVGINRFVGSGSTVFLEIPCAVVTTHTANVEKRRLSARAIRVDATAHKHLVALKFQQPLITAVERKSSRIKKKLAGVKSRRSR